MLKTSKIRSEFMIVKAGVQNFIIAFLPFLLIKLLNYFDSPKSTQKDSINNMLLGI